MRKRSGQVKSTTLYSPVLLSIYLVLLEVIHWTFAYDRQKYARYLLPLLGNIITDR